MVAKWYYISPSLYCIAKSIDYGLIQASVLPIVNTAGLVSGSLVIRLSGDLSEAGYAIVKAYNVPNYLSGLYSTIEN